MRKGRKLAALLVGVLMATTVTGCANTKYAVKADGEEIKAGIYIGYLEDTLITQVNTLYYQGITDDVLNQQVEGMTLSEYAKQEALRNTKEYYAIKKQFEAEGLSFTDDEIEALNSSFKDAWDNSSELFEEIGVGKESYKEIYRDYLRRSRLFSYYYEEGGSKAPTEDEMVKYIDDNYLRYKIMAFYKSSSDDEAVAAEANKEAEEKRDHYYELGKDMTFEEFDQLIKQKQDDDAAEAAEEAEEAEEAEGSEETEDSRAEDESTDETEASSEESTEESADESIEEADASADDSSAEETESIEEAESIDENAESTEEAESLEESSEAESSEEESTDDSEDESADSEEEEEEDLSDPYVNEAMNNYGEMDEEELSTPSGELYQFIHDADENKVLKFESDYGYYIVIKGDVTERSADYLEENRSTILEEMKSDEFDALIQSWVDAIDFKVNEKAINRYSPDTIYKKINDYYEEKNGTTSTAS